MFITSYFITYLTRGLNSVYDYFNVGKAALMNKLLDFKNRL